MDVELTHNYLEGLWCRKIGCKPIEIECVRFFIGLLELGRQKAKCLESQEKGVL